MKRVLITGATGFVGANLARRMLKDGHEVHLIVRPNHQSWRLEGIQRDVRLIDADLNDAQALDLAIASVRPDWIFHLAAYGAYSEQTDVRRIAQTNYLGTVNLLEACLRTGFEAFINTGSSSEYGFKDHAPAEDEWVEPNSFYAVGKVAATLHCRYVAISRNLPIRTLRLYSVYGPFEDPIRFIPKLIINGLEGGYPPLANAAIARDFVHSEDVDDAFIAVATVVSQEPGAVYNVGTGVQTTLLEAVATARRLVNIRPEPVWGTLQDRHWDTSVWVADIGRIRRELNWSPRFSFEAGLMETINWFKHNPEYISFYRRYIDAE